MKDKDWKPMNTAPHNAWILLKCNFHDKGLNRVIAKWAHDEICGGDYGEFRWEQNEGSTIAEKIAVGWLPLP